MKVNYYTLFFVMVLIFVLSSFVVHGQHSQRSITSTYITEEINIDGVLNEAAWLNEYTVTDFRQNQIILL